MTFCAQMFCADLPACKILHVYICQPGWTEMWITNSERKVLGILLIPVAGRSPWNYIKLGRQKFGGKVRRRYFSCKLAHKGYFAFQRFATFRSVIFACPPRCTIFLFSTYWIELLISGWSVTLGFLPSCAYLYLAVFVIMWQLIKVHRSPA